jgi:hypothetical protein
VLFNGARLSPNALAPAITSFGIGTWATADALYDGARMNPTDVASAMFKGVWNDASWVIGALVNGAHVDPSLLGSARLPIAGSSLAVAKLLVTLNRCGVKFSPSSRFDSAKVGNYLADHLPVTSLSSSGSK